MDGDGHIDKYSIYLTMILDGMVLHNQRRVSLPIIVLSRGIYESRDR